MKEESVEELAEKLESKFTQREEMAESKPAQKEKPAEKPEPKFARKEKPGKKPESRFSRDAGTDDLEEIDLEDFQEEWSSEKDTRKRDWEDDFSKEEDWEGDFPEGDVRKRDWEDDFSKEEDWEGDLPEEYAAEGNLEEGFPENESRRNRLGKGSSSEESRRKHLEQRNPEKEARNDRGKKSISEREIIENDWEDEEIAPMNPWMMAAAVAGLIVLAAIICAILWHFTHLDKGEEEQPSQPAATASIGNLDPADAFPEPTDTSAPDAVLPSESESISSSESAAPTSVPEAASSAPAEPTPASPSSTASAPGSSQAVPSAEPSSGAVQEPVSGTTAMEFLQSVMDVTPKDVVNLRSEPTTLDPDNIVAQVKNGEVLHRTGVNQSTGWTRLEYNGETVYAVSLLMTTDLTYKTPVQAADPNRVTVMDGRIILFTDCNDNLTPKEYVNLRTEPSTSQGDTTVRCQVSNGEVVHRTGYSPDAGWSRVEYNGEVLYVVSSYMYTVE